MRLIYIYIIILKHVSCEFDKFRVDSHLCKLRDTPAARLSYGCCQGEHQQQINHVSYYTYSIPTKVLIVSLSTVRLSHGWTPPPHAHHAGSRWRKFEPFYHTQECHGDNGRIYTSAIRAICALCGAGPRERLATIIAPLPNSGVRNPIPHTRLGALEVAVRKRARVFAVEPCGREGGFAGEKR